MSLIAILLSVVSLTWQIVAHWLNGHRVVVTMGSAIPLSPGDRTPDCVTITASNRGRVAVTVTSVAVDVGDGRTVPVSMWLIEEMSDRLPIRLEPGSSATWAYPYDVDDRIVSAHPVRRAIVGLGTGRHVRSRRH